MKHIMNRTIIAGALVAILGIFASTSQAKTNIYLELKEQTTGTSYRCPVNGNGKFSFEGVAPGKYTISVSFNGDACLSTIELSSFSWGASNSGSLSAGSASTGKSTQVTRSNISNNRSASPSPVAASGVRVAVGDVDGDGVMDMITSPVVVTLGGNKPASNETVYPTIVLRDILVSSVCSPKGDLKATYDIKMNKK